MNNHFNTTWYSEIGASSYNFHDIYHNYVAQASIIEVGAVYYSKVAMLIIYDCALRLPCLLVKQHPLKGVLMTEARAV